MSKKEFILLSDKARKLLSIEFGTDITEELLKEKCDRFLAMYKKAREYTSSIMPVCINEQDIPILSDYMDSEEIDIFVNGEKVTFDKDFIKFAKDYNGILQISLTRLLKYSTELNLNEKKLELIIQQEELENISEEDLKSIFNEYNIDSCTVRINDILSFNDKKISEIPNLRICYKDSKFEEKKDTINVLKEKISLLIQGINESDGEFDKFLTIYQRIAKNITFDRLTTDLIGFYEKNQSSLSKELKQRIDNSQNLQGLITKSTICSGYSRILQCALNSVGIECRYIRGIADGEEYHAWNQVKIDGRWYNTDLTWDRDAILGIYKPANCLKSDEDFYGHSALVVKEQCLESYDRTKIHQWLGIKSALENVLFIKEKKKEMENELKIDITIDNDNLYTILIHELIAENGRNIEGNMIGNPIKLESGEFVEFIREFSKNFHIDDSKAEEYPGIKQVKTKEGVEICIYQDMNEEMKKKGIDLYDFLMPRDEPEFNIGKDSIINGEIVEQTNPILEEEQSMDLIEHKTNIWKKLGKFIASKINQIQHFFKIKKEEKKQETNLSDDLESQCKNKLPSWDLRNWSSEELTFYAEQSKKEVDKQPMATTDNIKERD